ncbi:MAG: ubiquinol oxidase subunit II [Desulfobacterales bacterium]
MKKKSGLVFIGLSLFCAAVLLGGCSDMLLFIPKGPIGDAERLVIIVAIALMLIVVIPVAVMVFWFPRKYRASNTKATYMPKWSYSGKIELVVWLVPALIITVLGTLIWHYTFHLDPYKPIDTGVKPIRIEAVSLDWKWLFIYPDHKIAAVNQLVFPAKVPLSFRLTSDTVMTSLFIPQLGSQIYAMAGMQTRLHIMADEPGTYLGQNQQFSGRGFAGMHFKAIALPREQFDAWVQKVKQSPEKLDLARYEELQKPSTNYPVVFFSWVKTDLFEHIIRQFNKTMFMKPGTMNEGSGSMHHKTGALEES